MKIQLPKTCRSEETCDFICQEFIGPTGAKDESIELSKLKVKESENLTCTQEVKECSDGIFVKRDPERNCNWMEC